MSQENVSCPEGALSMGREIKVMVADDSAIVRKIMSAILDRDLEIRVIATAHDPIFTIEEMRRA